MAMIDSNIYFQQKTADPMGSFAEGMKMGDMIKQRRQEQAIQDAYKAGIVQNPDGSIGMDTKKTTMALMQVNPQAAYQYQQDRRAEEAAQLKLKKEKQQADFEDITRAAWKVNDQNSYDVELKNLSLKGIDISQLPKQYNPQMIDQVRRQTLSVKDRLDELDKHRKNAIELEKLAVERSKVDKKANSGLTEGIKALDKDFAKDYNEWTSGGAKRARNEIEKLQGVINRLNDGKGTTGGLTGVLGDRLTSDDVLQNRADVQQSAMSLIKVLLSGATSDKDREQIVNTLWNEADSTQNNVERIKRFVADMKSRADDTDFKARHFEKNKTLSGYQGVRSELNKKPSESSRINTAQTKPQIFKTNEIDWAD